LIFRFNNDNDINVTYLLAMTN